MRVVILGTGDHARYTADIIERVGEHKIIDIVDSRTHYAYEAGIIALGDNYLRYEARKRTLKNNPDFKFINAIHPSCIISKEAKFGRGIVAMAGCIFNPGVWVDDFAFFATGAQIEHNCEINAFASVSAGSVLGGRVVVEEFAAITLGCTIFDRVRIGKNSVVGSGSLVTKDVPPNVLVYGSPAKVIRERKEGERFLK